MLTDVEFLALHACIETCDFRLDPIGQTPTAPDPIQRQSTAVEVFGITLSNGVVVVPSRMSGT